MGKLLLRGLFNISINITVTIILLHKELIINHIKENTVKNILFLTLALLLSNNLFAGYCQDLKIKEITISSDSIKVIPTSSHYSKYWRFYIRNTNTSNQELANAIKMAFSMNKSINFWYSAYNEDGDRLTTAPSCSVDEVAKWEETDMVISSITLKQ